MQVADDILVAAVRKPMDNSIAITGIEGTYQLALLVAFHLVVHGHNK